MHDPVIIKASAQCVRIRRGSSLPYLGGRVTLFHYCQRAKYRVPSCVMAQGRQDAQPPTCPTSVRLPRHTTEQAGLTFSFLLRTGEACLVFSGTCKFRTNLIRFSHAPEFKDMPGHPPGQSPWPGRKLGAGSYSHHPRTIQRRNILELSTVLTDAHDLHLGPRIEPIFC